MKLDEYVIDMDKLEKAQRLIKAKRVRKSREKLHEEGLRYLQVPVRDEHRLLFKTIAHVLRDPDHPLYKRVILKLQIIQDMVGN